MDALSLSPSSSLSSAHGGDGAGPDEDTRGGGAGVGRGGGDSAGAVDVTAAATRPTASATAMEAAVAGLVTGSTRGVAPSEVEGSGDESVAAAVVAAGGADAVGDVDGREGCVGEDEDAVLGVDR